jgi:protein involved in polysaccharide export with SLBB domain
VTGSVNTPRELVIRDRLTLGRAIAMAGGLQRMAKNDVHIYRQKEGLAGQDDLKYNFEDIKRGKIPDVELKPFDIIEVGESSLFSGKGMSDMFKGMVRGAPGLITHGVIY